MSLTFYKLKLIRKKIFYKSKSQDCIPSNTKNHLQKRHYIQEKVPKKASLVFSWFLTNETSV